LGFLGLGLELGFFGFLGLDLGLVYGYGLKPGPKHKLKDPKKPCTNPKSKGFWGKTSG